MDAEKILRFDVEGREFVYYQMGGDFQRTLKQYKQGFCPNTAVAIMRAIKDGMIDLTSLGS